MASHAPICRAGSRFDTSAEVFSNIEWLRFIAACAILLGHMSPHVWAAGGQQGGWLKAVWYVANAGPDVFFVISGAVIWKASKDATGWRQALRFISRRLARVYSAYWVFLALAALQLWLWAPYLLVQKDWLRSVALLPQDIDTLAMPVTWALTHLLAFYLLITVWIGLRRDSSSNVLWLVATVILLGNVYSIGVLDVYAEANLTSASWLWRLWLSPYQLEFIAGYMIAELLQRRPLRMPALLMLAGILLLALGCWINADVFAGRLISGYFTPQRVAIYAPGALLLVAGCIGLQHSGHAPWPRLAISLGAATYTLYLLHTIVLSGLYRVGFRDAVAGSALLLPAYLLVCLLLIGFAVLYARYVEDRLNLRLFRQIDRYLI